MQRGQPGAPLLSVPRCLPVRPWHQIASEAPGSGRPCTRQSLCIWLWEARLHGVHPPLRTSWFPGLSLSPPSSGTPPLLWAPPCRLSLLTLVSSSGASRQRGLGWTEVLSLPSSDSCSFSFLPPIPGPLVLGPRPRLPSPTPGRLRVPPVSLPPLWVKVSYCSHRRSGDQPWDWTGNRQFIVCDAFRSTQSPVGPQVSSARTGTRPACELGKATWGVLEPSRSSGSE